MEAKYAKLKAGSPNPFIDPAGYKSYVAAREATFHKELTKQQMDQRYYSGGLSPDISSMGRPPVVTEAVAVVPAVPFELERVLALFVCKIDLRATSLAIRLAKFNFSVADIIASHEENNVALSLFYNFEPVGLSPLLRG
jgi:hypothetical protein